MFNSKTLRAETPLTYEQYILQFIRGSHRVSSFGLGRSQSFRVGFCALPAGSSNTLLVVGHQH